MDQAYSLLLAGAMVLVTVALAAAAVSRFTSRRGAGRWARWLAAGSLVLDAASFLVHLAGGHRPGTENAMAPLRFLAEHPSFVIVAVLAAATAFVSRGR